MSEAGLDATNGQLFRILTHVEGPRVHCDVLGFGAINSFCNAYLEEERTLTARCRLLLLDTITLGDSNVYFLGTDNHGDVSAEEEFGAPLYCPPLFFIEGDCSVVPKGTDRTGLYKFGWSPRDHDWLYAYRAGSVFGLSGCEDEPSLVQLLGDFIPSDSHVGMKELSLAVGSIAASSFFFGHDGLNFELNVKLEVYDRCRKVLQLIEDAVFQMHPEIKTWSWDEVELRLKGQPN